MTGILSTQQEVALQTVCFALFLKLELNGVRDRVKQKEKEREGDSKRKILTFKQCWLISYCKKRFHKLHL